VASLLPRAVFSQGAGNRKAVVHADQEIGIIRPELHSHFAEHLGSCVYGGI
jgi:alpha-L-arabinofuranosidase